LEFVERRYGDWIYRDRRRSGVGGGVGRAVEIVAKKSHALFRFRLVASGTRDGDLSSSGGGGDCSGGRVVVVDLRIAVDVG